jgi:hypothetical protein
MLLYFPVGREWVLISIEDSDFAERFSAVFGVRTSPEAPKIVSSILVVGTSLYLVAIDGITVCTSTTEAVVVGIIDAKLDELLRSQISSSICTIHSCGIETNGQTAILVGLSGCGKTSLGLTLSLQGAYLIGDEFGYLNLDSGDYWHADYPIGLKNDTHIALPDLSNTSALAMVTPFGIHTTLYSTDDIRDVFFSVSGEGQVVSANHQESSRSISAVYFPQRIPGFTDVSIRSTSVTELPELLMPSVVGCGVRAAMFSALITIFNRQNVELFAIEYGESQVAANKILRLLSGS